MAEGKRRCEAKKTNGKCYKIGFSTALHAAAQPPPIFADSWGESGNIIGSEVWNC